MKPRVTLCRQRKPGRIRPYLNEQPASGEFADNIVQGRQRTSTEEANHHPQIVDRERLDEPRREKDHGIGAKLCGERRHTKARRQVAEKRGNPSEELTP
jgi:hypothetical protein